MNESELLQYALHEARKLNQIVANAYDMHDHESDIVGGVTLSAIRLMVKAIEEEIMSALMSMKPN